MTLKIIKLLSVTMMVIAFSGCQLLIDNRSRGSSAVVVVPTSEWDAMREASREVNQLKAELYSSDIPAAAQPIEIKAIPGSEAINFSNYTGASLGGCATLGIIELQHVGDMDDAITLLKNEAFRLNSNLLIPTTVNNKRTEGLNNIMIEARMLTCPLKLARGN